MSWKLVFLQPKLLYLCACVCAQAVTLHDTKLCETWDLGSNFFISQDDVLNQRMRWNVWFDPLVETHTLTIILKSIYTWNLLNILFICVTSTHCRQPSSTFLPQGGGSVPSSCRAEPLCPCWHVFLCSGQQLWSQLSQKVSGKVLLFRIGVVSNLWVIANFRCVALSFKVK